MTTTKIPQYGDPEILPKGTVRRPSVERQPFSHGGRLKPDGPGPLTEERFYEAPDLVKLPQWERTRGNEWTTVEFRKIVFGWLIQFFDARDWPGKWDVKEVASAVRSVARLDDDRLHLVIGITPKEGERFETAVMFPKHAREDSPENVLAVLGQAEVTLDALQQAQG
jgi:hypothetical protein